MSERDRKAIQSAEMNVSNSNKPANADSKNYIESMTKHSDWDRDDYDLNEIGGFESVEPGEGLDWEEELDRVRDRLLELKQKRDLDAHEDEEKKRLKVKERKIEAYLNESD